MREGDNRWAENANKQQREESNEQRKQTKKCFNLLKSSQKSRFLFD